MQRRSLDSSAWLDRQTTSYTVWCNRHSCSKGRSLHVAHLVEKNNADLDVEAVSLCLLINLLKKCLGLFEDVRLCGSAGLVQHEYDVGRFCLALTGEGKSDLSFEVLVECGRSLDVLR